jgi:UDP-N-acetylmuramoylalanine--D-glutamate ligase
MMELENKNVLVVGLKRTGVALAQFLAGRHARVVITDLSDEKSLSPFIEKIRNPGIRFELGRHPDEIFLSADLIVLSPGVPHSIAPIQKARANNIPVVGEIELAYRFIQEPIVAVTGTNGKTTTTELLGAICRRSGKKVFVGGNIGNPLIGYVDQPEKADIVVAEISSFQLDTTDTFRPAVGVLLNITDDHLDRYDGFDAYAASKMRIFSQQGPSDKAILNASDPVVIPFLKEVKGQILNFNAAHIFEPGSSIQKDHIGFHPGGSDNRKLDLAGVLLKGKHNLENISAAGLAAMAVGCTLEDIRSVLGEFKGLSHRVEYVKTVHGIKFFDDSKGTNVDAVKKAIETFDEPIVLIMGGRDKGGNFSLLKEGVRNRVKHLVAMGEAQDVISSALKGCARTSRAKDMKDAVAQAAEAAAPGDVVLLSPGCASFDMFESYARRGDAFKIAVNGIDA